MRNRVTETAYGREAFSEIPKFPLRGIGIRDDCLIAARKIPVEEGLFQQVQVLLCHGVVAVQHAALSHALHGFVRFSLQAHDVVGMPQRVIGVAHFVQQVAVVHPVVRIVLVLARHCHAGKVQEQPASAPWLWIAEHLIKKLPLVVQSEIGHELHAHVPAGIALCLLQQSVPLPLLVQLAAGNDRSKPPVVPIQVEQKRDNAERDRQSDAVPSVRLNLPERGQARAGKQAAPKRKQEQ